MRRFSQSFLIGSSAPKHLSKTSQRERQQSVTLMNKTSGRRPANAPVVLRQALAPSLGFALAFALALSLALAFALASALARARCISLGPTRDFPVMCLAWPRPAFAFASLVQQ
eukprot:Skav213786  [mRNA]  locus=scaffold1122:58574:59513:- [translate_table: standard]